MPNKNILMTLSLVAKAIMIWSTAQCSTPFKPAPCHASDALDVAWVPYLCSLSPQLGGADVILYGIMDDCNSVLELVQHRTLLLQQFLHVGVLPA